MDNKNTSKLIKRYPKLYKQFFLDMSKTCMCWGFQCDDGWYKLIDKLSNEITKIDPNIQATCVKEKFGTLRFYFEGAQDEKTCDKIHNLLHNYDTISSKTCEECGKPGKLRKLEWWLQTLCNTCFKKAKHKVRK